MSLSYCRRAGSITVELLKRVGLLLVLAPIFVGAWTLGVAFLLLIGASDHAATAWGLLGVPVYVAVLYVVGRTGV